MADGITGPEGHAYSRPPEVEGEAANRAIMIADAAGTPLYIVHVSCEQAHEAIRRARQKGMRVYGEPLIQHLTLDESEYFDKDWQYAARRVMSPALPLQGASGRALGRADPPARSRSWPPTTPPSATSRSAWAWDDFTRIPNGTGGLEERMGMLWTRGVDTGRLTPEEFVAVTSTNIAKILNIYPMKGGIAVGGDADLGRLGTHRSTAPYRSPTQKSIIDYNVFRGHGASRAAARYTLSTRRSHLGPRPELAAPAGAGEIREAPGLRVGVVRR